MSQTGTKRGRDGWTPGERALLRRLRNPAGVQAYLDGLAYRAEEKAACPRNVMVERRAHCFDGALFAAAALRELGHPPLLLDMWADRDDDHVLAVFRANGCYGAVAKSNFVGLRFREPIHRTLRELVLSYFEGYFNLEGEKTLRAYSGLLHLRQFDRQRWMFRDDPLPVISERLDALRHRPILTPRMKRGLTPVDPRSMEAGMLGTRLDGVYKAG
ncbi:MAG: hypothetical protein HZB56_02610 [Deltaproteobacteria bacterium]|nr:hypothetical protein [Deltaproteobacteria bacterium]